jgi:hypothetical protein
LFDCFHDLFGHVFCLNQVACFCRHCLPLGFNFGNHSFFGSPVITHSF